MDGQTLARIGKAVLALSAALGIGIEPEHIELIAAGVAGLYGIMTAIEAWLRKRRV